jgi:hypothetical protein
MPRTVRQRNQDVPVSLGENLRRGAHPNFLTKASGICKRGHRIEEENAYIRRDGRPLCHTCKLARQAEGRERARGRNV